MLDSTVADILRSTKPKATLKFGLMVESLCQDLSKSALSMRLLTSAMNICIEGYAPAGTSIAQSSASSSFSLRRIEDD
jgi:hypothetical protein